MATGRRTVVIKCCSLLANTELVAYGVDEVCVSNQVIVFNVDPILYRIGVSCARSTYHILSGCGSMLRGKQERGKRKCDCVRCYVCGGQLGTGLTSATHQPGTAYSTLKLETSRRVEKLYSQSAICLVYLPRLLSCNYMVTRP